MPDIITITGLVATEPRHILTSEGLAITSFRLASAQRRFDRSQERWIDAETNWYTITTFRQLALNCATSILKGQRVVVTGRLRIREWDNGERVGTTVDVEAEAVGHDLSWGTASFSRSIVSSSAPVAEAAHEERGAHGEEQAERAEEGPAERVGERQAEGETQAVLAEEPAAPF